MLRVTRKDSGIVTITTSNLAIASGSKIVRLESGLYALSFVHRNSFNNALSTIGWFPMTGPSDVDISSLAGTFYKPNSAYPGVTGFNTLVQNSGILRLVETAPTAAGQFFPQFVQLSYGLILQWTKDATTTGNWNSELIVTRIA